MLCHKDADKQSRRTRRVADGDAAADGINCTPRRHDKNHSHVTDTTEFGNWQLSTNELLPCFPATLTCKINHQRLTNTNASGERV